MPAINLIWVYVRQVTLTAVYRTFIGLMDLSVVHFKDIRWATS